VARMPRYEKIRNQRDRAFKKRSIAPKRNIVLAIINSAFFLWFLSAVLLTVGGGYITNHQQCMRDADALIERRHTISQELNGRENALLSELEAATTLSKLPDTFSSTKGSFYPQWSKHSFFYVAMEETIGLANRTQYDSLPETEILKTQNKWSDFIRSIDESQKPMEGKPQKIEPNREFKRKKLGLQLLFSFRKFQREFNASAYNYQPDCTPLKTLGVALGYKPKNVRASVSPYFGDGNDIMGTLTEEIERLDQLKSDLLSLDGVAK
jgi:hypothetical protein